MDAFQKEVYIRLINRAIGTNGVTHFAKKAGISAGNLCRIRKGQLAKVATLKRIAAASEDVTYAELMAAAGYTETSLLKAADPLAVPTTNRVMGVPVVASLKGSKKQIKNDETLEREYLYADVFPDGDYIFFVVNDDAFEPRISKGDRVLVDMSRKPAESDPVLFLLKGKETMLRYLMRRGKKYLYYGSNISKYPMTEVAAADIEIYGTAVRAYVSM